MNYAKKSLGQNFLIDKNIIKKILSLTNIKNSNIIEIGPGKGALTSEILKHNPRSVKLIEKDTDLVKKLKIEYKNKYFLKIYNKDFLKFNLEDVLEKNTTIFGNLPYNISSQILVKILKIKNFSKINNLVLMFQKELGEKIISKFPSKNYGRLSILSNFKFEVINKFLVSSNCFFPKPSVVSMVIHFKPKKKYFFNINDIENLEKITSHFFSSRRKMIKNKFLKLFSNDDIKNIKGLKLNLRPSDLRPEIYYQITELFEKKL